MTLTYAALITWYLLEFEAEMKIVKFTGLVGVGEVKYSYKESLFLHFHGWRWPVWRQKNGGDPR